MFPFLVKAEKLGEVEETARELGIRLKQGENVLVWDEKGDVYLVNLDEEQGWSLFTQLLLNKRVTSADIAPLLDA